MTESTAGILQRPARSTLTMLGTILGIASFVGILGLTTTASGQIDQRFTVLAATEVVVTDVGDGNTDNPAMSFPPEAGQRLGRLNGVVHAGVQWPVPLRDGTVSASVPLAGQRSGTGNQVTVMAVDPGALAVMHPTVAAGRLYDNFHESRGERVAVLGSAAARQLGISRLDAAPAVFISGNAYTVIGILADVRRTPEALNQVIIPATTALTAFGPPVSPRASMHVETRLGAAALISRQAALALRPDAPTLFQIAAPADPTTLRGNVASDLNALFLLLAAISLVVGAVGIANTTLVAVIERTPEIGLRRALGAQRRHIVGQFLTESTVLGTLGGLIGTSVGVGIVMLVAIVRDWTAILQPWAVLPAPLAGSLIGLLAGLYPALRAATIEPVAALRR